MPNSSEELPEPTDSLALPLPPVGLDFSIRSGSQSSASIQRYIRKGTARDASAAVVGKGGFGTAYRYVRDGSFTPPSSTLDNSNGADLRHAKTQVQEEACDSMESVRQTLRYCDTDDDTRMYDAADLTEGSLHQLGDANQKNEVGVPTAISPALCSSPYPSDKSRSKIPAVLVLKVCRTPTSGSYDELPKTGQGREEAKIASHQLTTGEVNGYHTRIVRGEARLLRYLQMVHSLKKKRGESCYVVRLLADVPHSTAASEEEGDDAAHQGGPPVPRLLIFERLVDLDAELTPKGWGRVKSLWTVERVESVSRDIVAGLAFLHDHHIVHGDLKPSNCMQDPKTGRVKLIDMGASRRWVRLPNAVKECTTAVEEYDKAVKEGEARLLGRDEILCEGLGSLTGSPHYMAPEVLLQAGRYLAADGYPKSILDDYICNYDCLADLPERDFLVPAYKDFKRGWGLKADVWSWGCTVISLLLRTLSKEQRPDSNTICAFDFSFTDSGDALEPLHSMHESNATLPRFHQWARMYPLRIMAILYAGVPLPSFTHVFSDTMIAMLQLTFQQCDARPNASAILDALDGTVSSGVSLHSQRQKQQHGKGDTSNCSKLGRLKDLPRMPSMVQSSPSLGNSVLSHPDEPNNVDLSESVSASARHLYSRQGQTNAEEGASEPSFIMLEPPPPPPPSSAPATHIYGGGGQVAYGPGSFNDTLQQNFLQNRLVHSPLASSMQQVSQGGNNPRLYPAAANEPQQQQYYGHQSMQSAAAAMDLSPAPGPKRQSSYFRHQQQKQKQQQQQPPPRPSLPRREVSRELSPPPSSSVRCSSTLLDDVFMEAYKSEERRMSPVPSIRLCQPAESNLRTTTTTKNGHAKGAFEQQQQQQGGEDLKGGAGGTGGRTMTRKKSTGLLGLGLDLHRPLRSVRSSLTVGGSNGNSAASHQQQSSNNNNNRSTTTSKTRTPSHSPSQSPFQPTFENGTVERQQYASHHPHQQGIKGGNDFLLHDPFPSRRGSHGHISGGGLDDDNSSKSGDVVHNGGGSSTTTTTTTAPCTRRGRSWSSIFKRKKML